MKNQKNPSMDSSPKEKICSGDSLLSFRILLHLDGAIFEKGLHLGGGLSGQRNISRQFTPVHVRLL